MKDLVDLARLFEGPLNRLDRRGAVSMIALAATVVVCAVFALRDFGTLWQLLPVTVLTLLIVGGFLLVRWRILAASDHPEAQPPVSEASSQPAEPQGLLADPIEADVLPPVAPSNEAAAETHPLPAPSRASESQFITLGAMGGLLAMLAANLVFVYLEHVYGLTLLQAQLNQAGRIVLCLPFTLSVGALLGIIVGPYARSVALYNGLQGQSLTTVTVYGCAIASFIGMLIMDVVVWFLSYM